MSEFNIEWSSKYGQEVTINGYTVPVVGAYHSQGHVVLDGNDKPKLLSFVGVWIEGTSKLINVPAPCEGWEEVLEAYKEHDLLAPLFLTYQQAKDWLDMLNSGRAPFGGILSVQKNDRDQGLTIMWDGYNHWMSYAKHSGMCYLSEPPKPKEDICYYRNGLWEAERVCHMKDSFIYSTEEEDEENDWINTVLHWKDLTYLESLSPQQLRQTVGYHFHLSNDTLYHSILPWQIEMIKAADEGDGFALSVAKSLGFFV
jgi:hypothetical protein